MRNARFTIALVALGAIGLMACPDNDESGDGILKPIDADVIIPDGIQPPQDVTIPKAALGEPCLRQADCASGICAPGPEGNVCAASCDSDPCDAGQSCVPIPLQGAPAQNVCVDDDVLLCQPCASDDDCNLPGNTGATCLDYGSEGGFCGAACVGADDCPSGYSCDSGQCVADGMQCSCNLAGIALGRSTSCEVVNGEGACPGERACTVSGLSRCDGPKPRAEVCNGRDDNCDGDVDEDTDGAECTLENEFGTCIGAVSCQAGSPVCVGRAPAAEICDGIDNDCDGLTDEDQADFDMDLLPNCTDPDIDGDGDPNESDCNDFNAAISSLASEICNGIDDDCTGVIDDDNAECDCYVCLGTAGCRADCTKDGHCAAGYLCDFNDDNENEISDECLPSVCGNGDVEIREVCDNGVNAGNYNGCQPGCQALGPRCGDGNRDAGFEACDDGELNGEPLKCNLTCSGITPPDCGNGVKESGEGCDLGVDTNSNAPNAECRTDCSVRRCGDGVVDDDFDEGCDAANANGATTCACTDGCQFPGGDIECRGSEGVCDQVEVCDGAGACPDDAKLDAQDEACRGADGLCDAAEFCNGTDNDCPDDAVRAVDSECRDSVGDCDAVDVCDGESKDCADLKLGANDAACRPAADLCDAAEFCDGQANTCPATDMKVAEGTLCREADGDCDVDDFCDGESDACDDDVAHGETVCRDAVDDCDQLELCDGETKGCGDNLFTDEGELCSCEDGPCGCDGAGMCLKLCGNGVVDEAAGETCDDGDEVNGTSGFCDFDCKGLCEPDHGWVTSGGGPSFDALLGLSVDENGTSFSGGIFQTNNPFANQDVLISGPGFCGDGQCLGDEVFDCDIDCVAPAVFGDHEFRSTDGSRDIFLQHLDVDGSVIWATCGGGPYRDELVAVGHDLDGNVYTTGTFQQRIGFGCCGNSNGAVRVEVAKGPGQFCTTGVNSNTFDERQFFAIANSNGQFVYSTSGIVGDDGFGLGGPQQGPSNQQPREENTNDMAVTPRGASAAVGYYRLYNDVAGPTLPQGMTGDVPPDRVQLEDFGGQDIFIVKRNGIAWQWTEMAGSPVDDQATAVAIDGAGDIYVAGNFGADFFWDDHFVDYKDDNGTQGFVAKLGGDDAQVRWIATMSFQEEGSGVQTLGIDVDNVGNVFISGSYDRQMFFHSASGSEPDLGPTIGDIPPLQAVGIGEFDAFVGRLDPGGQWVWAQNVTADAGIAYDVAVDRAGKLHVTGGYAGVASFGENILFPTWDENGTFYTQIPDDNCSDIPIPSGPGFEVDPSEFFDGFVGRMNGTDGTWEWVTQFGGRGEDGGIRIDTDPRGGIFMGGVTSPSWAVGDDNATGCPVDFQNGGLNFDATVWKQVPPGAPNCFACGDGILDPGEVCDESDGLDHCSGACDGICSGPANICGDGWVECGEAIDPFLLPTDSELPPIINGTAVFDPQMCQLATGNLWCFELEGGDWTDLPIEPGQPVAFGAGIQLDDCDSTVCGGNAIQDPACPAVTTELSARAQKWGGDLPGNLLCDSDPSTPPRAPAIDYNGDNSENAAIECDEYYEFVGNTGEGVAFYFDEVVGTGGPDRWSLWLSFSGQDGTYFRVADDNTTLSQTGGFPDGGVPTPMHTVVIEDANDGDAGLFEIFRLSHKVGIHFRLYAYNVNPSDNVEPSAYWSVDNVKIGPPPPNPWINEIHYDDDGADVNEFVEIAGPAGTSLDGWTLYLYNGSSTTRNVYNTFALSGVIPDQGGGGGTVAISTTGIQNGSPDGLALANADDKLIQFISYEGTFIAVDGPAAGVTSVDIGVNETDDGDGSTSLQLIGSGCSYADFTWTGPEAGSRGDVNTGQTFTCSGEAP